MVLKNILIVLVVFSFGLKTASYAQLSGSTLLEYQNGKLPADSKTFSSGYGRTLLAYDYKKFKAGATLEQYYTPFAERNYTQFTQYSLQFRSKYFDAKLGNFQETIGRGILLRSFEVPGAVIEDLSYRSRNYFQRDVFGITTNFKYKDFSAKVLYGKPLSNVFPPTINKSIRRPDEVKAIYADYNFFKQTFGASVMSVENNNSNQRFGMATLSGKISPVVSYYTEFAREIDNKSEFKLQTNSKPHAYYANVNLTFENLGITAEVKDYKDFSLGSGINEPPALVKQHSYKTLNRSTHVPQIQEESGYQIEVFYTFKNNSILTFNNAMARNKLVESITFSEYFLEYDFAVGENKDFKVFFDYAKDPFKLEKNRISSGVYADWKITKKNSLKTEYEFQTFDRNGQKTQNHVFVLGYNINTKYSFNLVSELSNDSFLITTKKNKTWLGLNSKYQFNKTNNIQLFAGERRGGPACTAGVCYEIFDFKGVELRWTSRF